MAFRLSCPSCNTSFTVPELPGDRRAACPRCGDVFPLRTWEETADASPTLVVPSPEVGGLWSKQLLAIGLALIVLTVGLLVYFNRDRLRGRPTPGPEAAGTVKPATQLAGIGYLPADTNIAFAVQAGPVLAHAERTRQDPRGLLVRAGVPNQLFEALARLDLTLEQIDHLAGGTSLGDGPFEFRFTLVLVLRGALPDEDQFLQKLKARKHAGGKPRYDVELGGLPLTLARVSETVWVFGFDGKKDLQAVERDGFGPGGQQFTPSLTGMLVEQVPPAAAAWIATADERWAEKPATKIAAQFLDKKEWLSVLPQGRAGMLALSFNDAPRVRLHVKTTDEATGQQVRDYFKRKVSDKMQLGGEGDTAFFEMPLSEGNALVTLQRFIADAVQK